MDTLWAPWRLEYLTDEKPAGCIFCTFPTETRDRDNLILWRGKHCYVIMNRYPYNCGHVMVVPYGHIGEIYELSAPVQADIMRTTGECCKILRSALGAHACNCGMNIGHDAGAGILDHVHIHVVPRWRGDANFFPVIADTKAMPEYLAKTYAKLKPAFDQLTI